MSYRNVETEGAPPREIDIRAMRHAAGRLLGGAPLTQEGAAKLIDVNRHTWKKWERVLDENGDPLPERERSYPSAGQIRLFWVEVCLRKLAKFEKKYGAGAVLSAELGGPIQIFNILAYIDKHHAPWRPY
jgi:hypothetical protein